MSSSLTAIIMLSGLSSRMNGKDKLLIEINDKPLAEYLFDTISQCDFLEVIAVCRKKEIIESAIYYNFKYVVNDNFANGISESIKLGVLHASEKSKGYMFFQGDQILINKSHIKKLEKYFEQNEESIIVPNYNGVLSSPCIFPKRLKNELLLLEGDDGGKKIISTSKKSDITLVNINSDTAYIDIDYITDLEKVSSILNQLL